MRILALFGKTAKRITKEQTDMFVQGVLHGPVLCRIRITDVGDLLNALKLYFTTQGMSMGQVLDHIDQNLVGICPACHTNSAGKGLATLNTYQRMRSQRTKIVLVGDSAGGERLLAGKCRNKNCSCDAILISWRPKGIKDSTEMPFLQFYT